MMLDVNSKWNRNKNTSESNWNKIRAREKAITNTRDLFRDSSTKLYIPPSPCEGFHYPLRIFPQRSLHKETTSSTQDRSTQLQLSILYTRGSIKPMRFTSSWWPQRSQTLSFI